MDVVILVILQLQYKTKMISLMSSEEQKKHGLVDIKIESSKGII